jgi:hypothetical protein
VCPLPARAADPLPDDLRDALIKIRADGAH